MKMYERNHFNGAAPPPRQIPLSAADLYINEEWRIQLLPLQIQNTHVVLLCEAWAMWHTDGLRDFGSRDDANWGSLGNKEGHESMKYEWDACFWVEHTAEWVGGWEKKEWEGGPQCMLLSSLQGLCSAELICCEMCKYCLDWCLVCRRDGEEEKEDGWGELWGGSLMKQDLKRWNHPQGEEALIPNHPAIHALLNPYHCHTFIGKYVMVEFFFWQQEQIRNLLKMN